MTDPRIKLNSQISEEAAEWFVEFRTGDIDVAGRRAFDIWVRGSQEHLRAYLEIAAIWNECDALDAQRAWDTDALISLADDNVVPLTVPDTAVHADNAVSGTEQPRRKHGSVRYAIAASVAFLVCTLAALTWLQFYGMPTYATDVGEQRSVRLTDGSTVELNSRSRLRIHFTDAERAVELLEGQALFHVAKNPARPFIVRSDDTDVRAVGTRFDVNRRDSGTVVTVIEGKVAVDSPRTPDTPEPGTASAQGKAVSGTLLLSAGEQVTIAKQTIPTPRSVNTTAATAWTHRQLVLESAPLNEVASEFNRYSTRKLIVEDSTSSELRLSGVFETDPDFLIRYLRDRPDITIHETDTEIRIVRHD